MQKAFEYDNHDLLAQLAVEEGMPGYLVRLVAGAYRWERRICIDGMLSGAILTNRGISAGDFAATYMLKAYMLRLCRRQQERHPEVLFTFHIDDASLEATGTEPRPTAAAMAKAAKDLKEGLEQDLGARLAMDKIAMATSDVGLAMLMRRKLGDLAG